MARASPVLRRPQDACATRYSGTLPLVGFGLLVCVFELEFLLAVGALVVFVLVLSFEVADFAGVISVNAPARVRQHIVPH